MTLDVFATNATHDFKIVFDGTLPGALRNLAGTLLGPAALRLHVTHKRSEHWLCIKTDRLARGRNIVATLRTNHGLRRRQGKEGKERGSKQLESYSQTGFYFVGDQKATKGYHTDGKLSFCCWFGKYLKLMVACSVLWCFIVLVKMPPWFWDLRLSVLVLYPSAC